MTVASGLLTDPEYVTLAYDDDGSVTDIYLSDTVQSKIFRLDPEPPYALSLVASAATSALLDRYPRDLVVDGNGDLLVAQDSPTAGAGRILRVNPTTGVVSVVSEGGLLHTPMSLAIERTTGDLLVADADFGWLREGAIIRVSPGSPSTQSVVHLGPFAVPHSLAHAAPFGLDIAANGDVLLLELYETISRIDVTNPTPAGRTEISVGGFFNAPWEIALDLDENVLVGDYGARATMTVW